MPPALGRLRWLVWLGSGGVAALLIGLALWWRPDQKGGVAPAAPIPAAPVPAAVPVAPPPERNPVTAAATAATPLPATAAPDDTDAPDEIYDSPQLVAEREKERERAEAEGEALARDANHEDHSGERPGERFQGPPTDPGEEADPGISAAAAAPARSQQATVAGSGDDGLPSLEIDVHAYSSDPQKSFVMIGGRRYHEGDTLAEGPRVLRIVPAGTVLQWRGREVLRAAR